MILRRLQLNQLQTWFNGLPPQEIGNVLIGEQLGKAWVALKDLDLVADAIFGKCKNNAPHKRTWLSKKGKLERQLRNFESILDLVSSLKSSSYHQNR